MPCTCKGLCTAIAAQQDAIKQNLFKKRQRGNRPRTMKISTISKYCKGCNERFYFIDYIFCKCCGLKLRSRSVHHSLGVLDKDKDKWSMMVGVVPS